MPNIVSLKLVVNCEKQTILFVIIVTPSCYDYTRKVLLK